MSLLCLENGFTACVLSFVVYFTEMSFVGNIEELLFRSRSFFDDAQLNLCFLGMLFMELGKDPRTRAHEEAVNTARDDIVAAIAAIDHASSVFYELVDTCDLQSAFHGRARAALDLVIESAKQVKAAKDSLESERMRSESESNVPAADINENVPLPVPLQRTVSSYPNSNGPL